MPRKNKLIKSVPFFEGWWFLLLKGYTKDGFLYVVINKSEYIKNRWVDCVSLLNSTVHRGRNSIFKMSTVA